MEASIFNMMMSDQIFRNENQEAQKHADKKHHAKIIENAVELEQSQQQSKAQNKRKKQRTLLAKRRSVAEAMGKKTAQNNKTAQTKTQQKTKLSRAKTQNHKSNVKNEKGLENSELKENAFEKLNTSRQGLVRQFAYSTLKRNMEFKEPILEDVAFIPNEEDIPEDFQTNEPTSQETQKNKNSKTAENKTSKAVKEHLKNLTPAEKKAYMTKIISGDSKQILDALINPKYLVGCNLTEAEILLLREKVSKRARLYRKIMRASLPKTVSALRGAGFGNQLGAVGQSYKEPEEKKDDPNASVFASMAAALDLNALLQKLGVETNIVANGIQAEAATEEVSEAKKSALDNIEKIHHNLHRSKCQKLLKIFSYIAAAIMILIGEPEIGLLMIAATSGLLEYLIEKLAKALGMSDFAMKSLIMLITIIVAVAAASPEIMGEDAISGLSAFGNSMLIAGSIGFFQDAIGFCATGQTNEAKFPSWVTWAALGINLGAMIPDLAVSGYRMITSALEKVAARGAKAAEEAMASAEAAAADAKAMADSLDEGAQSAANTKAISGAADRGEEDAARALDEGAGGTRGASLAEGADTAAAASSTMARSTVRPAEVVQGSAESAAVQAVDEGLAPVESATSSGSVSEPESETSGAGLRSTVAGAAKADARSVEEAMESGEEAINSAAALSGASSAAEGLESYAAIEKEVTQTLKDAKENDPFKANLRKAMDGLKKAEEDLDRLIALEERSGSAAEEDASALATSLKKAQEEVEKAQKEVAHLVDRFSKQEEALGKVSQKLEELKALRAAKLDELSHLNADPIANAGAIKSIEQDLAEIESKVGKLAEEAKLLESTENELAKAESDLAEAQAKVAKYEKTIKETEGSGVKSKYKELKAYLRSNFGRLGKIMLLADTMGQAYAEFKLAEIDLELGRLIAEIAEITGSYELLGVFFDIFGYVESTQRDQNQQYTQELHDEVKLIGDIINKERRASNMLASA